MRGFLPRWVGRCDHTTLKPLPQGTPLDANAPLRAWADALATPSPSPAGGSAAAVAAGLAASLVCMVAGLVLARDRYAAEHQRARASLERARQLQRELMDLAASDAAAFAGFERALALPVTTDAERAAREQAKQAARLEGARLQRDLAVRALEVGRLGAHLVERGPASARGDAATAVFLAAAAARSAARAVRDDLRAVGSSRQDWLDEAEQAARAVDSAEREVIERLERQPGVRPS